MIKVELPKIIIIIRNILDYFEILFFKILAEIYKIFNRNPIWLIGERHDTAEENGLYFYRYLKTEQPREKSYYVIDKRSKQYNSVKDFKEIIQFNSLKHKILFLVSSFYVTSHNHYCIPKSIFGKKRYLMPTSIKNVFLDHGITYADVSEFYGKKNSGIDLFICGAQPEEDYVKAKFGYKSSEVAYTGFARFDGLHDFKIKKQILVMPTWRKNIYNLKEYSEEERELFFKNSEFYKTFQSLLTNQELFELLEKFHYRLIFYPHYEIHNFLQYFSSDNKNIVIASKDKYHVQALLRDSALLITDTSSVHFDFAYMFKPVIYYKFDKESFINSHLPVGYYIHETMGFGEVVEKEQPLITLIENYLKNDCTIEDVFSKRVKEFYPLYDIKNCERIYNSIVDNK
jgi:CDP-glycerol glycerophosphotransferase (TagB/SpsB family)